MKRLTAILLLFLLFFTLFGYKVFIDCLQLNQVALAEEKVETNQYDEDELITIKSPIQLPYYNNSETFEKVYGSTEVDGVIYTYVKRRIYNDSLELLCLPDFSKQQLQAAKNELVKRTVDGSSTNHNPKNSIIKPLFPELYYNAISFFEKSVAEVKVPFINSNINLIEKGYASKAKQPPETMI